MPICFFYFYNLQSKLITAYISCIVLYNKTFSPKIFIGRFIARVQGIYDFFDISSYMVNNMKTNSDRMHILV